MERQTIRDFYGKILGYIETNSATGIKKATNFQMLTLGTYDPNQNVTRDFYGRILANGDILASLIMNDANN